MKTFKEFFEERDYKKEYQDYHSKPEQIKRRSSRNKARRLVASARGKDKLKGKDVDHFDKNPLNNSLKNLRITSIKKNRSKK